MTGRDTPVLSVEGLCTDFHTHAGVVHAVDDVSFSVGPGEILGLVGESGCGKSVTSLSVMGLVAPPGRVAAGKAVLAGHGDLLQRSANEMHAIRGDAIAMIFQEPMTSLNPVFRIGAQIAEAFRLHRRASRAEAMERAIDMLALVGIPEPAKRARSYPHQLSGGMRQRVMIAMAMVCDPELLLADEPTTALDVTVQAQILDLMRDLQAEKGSAILLITHDMGVIAETAKRVAVMYAGKVVEEAPVEALFAEAAHPYTRGLLSSIPSGQARGKPLNVIAGLVPNLLHLPTGCRFRARCPMAFGRCAEAEPPLTEVAPGHKARCWLHGDSAAAPDGPGSAAERVEA
ncbi:MAG: ABC transporter ATP-binding protein [Paracoccaceae bacterium]